MELNLSAKRREELEYDLAQAEPYSDDDPEMCRFHVPYDIARMRATRAKHLLERDDREKAEKARKNKL